MAFHIHWSQYFTAIFSLFVVDAFCIFFAAHKPSLKRVADDTLFMLQILVWMNSQVIFLFVTGNDSIITKLMLLMDITIAIARFMSKSMNLAIMTYRGTLIVLPIWIQIWSMDMPTRLRFAFALHFINIELQIGWFRHEIEPRVALFVEAIVMWWAVTSLVDEHSNWTFIF